jgi:hypothetical protein
MIADCTNSHQSLASRGREERTYSGVGTVSRDGNETNVPLLVSPRVVVRSDDGQTGVLSLSTRVGLERASRESSHRAEVSSKFLENESDEDEGRRDEHSPPSSPCIRQLVR